MKVSVTETLPAASRVASVQSVGAPPPVQDPLVLGPMQSLPDERARGENETRRSRPDGIVAANTARALPQAEEPVEPKTSEGLAEERAPAGGDDVSRPGDSRESVAQPEVSPVSALGGAGGRSRVSTKDGPQGCALVLAGWMIALSTVFAGIWL